MNVHGCANAFMGAKPNAARKRGPSTVSWSTKTSKLAANSRRTQGVMPKTRGVSIPSLSPRWPPEVPGEAADALAQLWELDPRGPGGLRVQTGARHARECVGLQAEDVALGRRPEVDAGVAAELQRAVGRERQLLELPGEPGVHLRREDRKSTRLNSSHGYISYAVFCLKKKKI